MLQIPYLLVFAPHIHKEREDRAKYSAKNDTFLTKVLVYQDKRVILQENYRQIRNIKEYGYKNTANNGV